MSQQSHGVVEIESPQDDLLHCRFPLNMRLHGARYGVFRVPIKSSGLTFRGNPSSVLVDILEKLQGEAEDLLDISGDYLRLNIRLTCGGALDSVLKQVVLACQANGFKCSYTRGCAPAYAA